jgi:hypothetical protein
MKKRLRKKFHTGEFTEFGFEVAFHLAAPVQPEAEQDLLEAFLDQIESQGLAGGGMSREGRFAFTIAAARPRVPVTEAHRLALEAWLKANPAIQEPRVGPLADAWHSDL